MIDLILKKYLDVVLDCDVQAQLSMDVEDLMKNIDILPKIRRIIYSVSKNTIYSITREEYMREVESLFEIIREECLLLMMGAHLPFYSYDSILVVGNYPLQNMMSSVFQKKIPLDLRFLSYESIVLGAIFYDQK